MADDRYARTIGMSSRTLLTHLLHRLVNKNILTKQEVENLWRDTEKELIAARDGRGEGAWLPSAGASASMHEPIVAFPSPDRFCLSKHLLPLVAGCLSNLPWSATFRRSRQQCVDATD
jgi:hypothetical protein